MASADILRAARARIEDPKNWTTKAFAKDAKGNAVFGDSDKAVCWCALGAVDAEIRGVIKIDPAKYLFDVCGRLFDVDEVSIVNDRFGHRAVLKLFDAAIAAAEAEAGR